MARTKENSVFLTAHSEIKHFQPTQNDILYYQINVHLRMYTFTGITILLRIIVLLLFL